VRALEQELALELALALALALVQELVSVQELEPLSWKWSLNSCRTWKRLRADRQIRCCCTG
jgi:hypothetical protein